MELEINTKKNTVNSSVKGIAKENTNQVSRSFLIREDFLNGLYELKENYSVSINSLVNIAIRNAVTEEKMETKGLDKLK